MQFKGRPSFSAFGASGVAEVGQGSTVERRAATFSRACSCFTAEIPERFSSSSLPPSFAQGRARAHLTHAATPARRARVLRPRLAAAQPAIACPVGPSAAPARACSARSRDRRSTSSQVTSHSVCLVRGGRLSAVPTVKANVPAGASAGTRCDDWGQPKGVLFCVFHAFDFSPCQTGDESGGPFVVSRGGTHLNQTSLPLLGRIDGPSVVPTMYLKGVATYRQAVRLCWALRRVHYMTQLQLAAEAGLYSKHVSDYLADDDKPGRRSLPGDRIQAFESVCGNTAVTQFLARNGRLTVLEEVQADRMAA